MKIIVISLKITEHSVLVSHEDTLFYLNFSVLRVILLKS